MNIEDYKSQIEIEIAAGNLIDDIKNSYREELSELEQEELELFESEIYGKYKKNKIETKQDRINRLLTKKQKDGISLWDRKKPLGEWLAYDYIPRFHTLKSPEIQAPIAACLMLININMYERGINGLCISDFPKVICLGFPGSGKTTWCEQLLKFHQKKYTINTQSSSTEISLIDRVSEINEKISGEKDPSLHFPVVLLDNLDKTRKKDDFTTYTDLFMFQKKESAIRSISKRSSSENITGLFNYYCYVLGTTIFDIRPLAKANPYYEQIVTRTIYLMFEASDNYENFKEYDWDNFHKLYVDFWEDEEKIAEYSNILDQFPKNHTDYDFPDMRAYSISKCPITVGVVSGVFETIIDGLYCFSEYWKSLDKLIDVMKDEKIELVRTWVKMIHGENIKELWRKELIKREQLPEWKHNEIVDSFSKKDINDYMLHECGTRLSEDLWSDQIPRLLRSLGYTRDETVRGYVFIRK